MDDIFVSYTVHVHCAHNVCSLLCFWCLGSEVKCILLLFKLSNINGLLHSIEFNFYILDRYLNNSYLTISGKTKRTENQKNVKNMIDKIETTKNNWGPINTRSFSKARRTQYPSPIVVKAGGYLNIHCVRNVLQLKKCRPKKDLCL
jgi:hypothetical protein